MKYLDARDGGSWDIRCGKDIILRVLESIFAYIIRAIIISTLGITPPMRTILMCHQRK